MGALKKYVPADLSEIDNLGLLYYKFPTSDVLINYLRAIPATYYKHSAQTVWENKIKVVK